MKANSDDCVAFSYEVKMIYVLLNHLKELPPDDPLPEWETAYRNALIESHLIHTRVLTEFFLQSAARPEDIVVGDFLEESWAPGGPALDRLRTLMPEIHRRMAHLTRRRHSPFKGYNPLLITGDVMELVSQFIDRIRQESPPLDPGLDHAVVARDYFIADYGDEYREIIGGPTSPPQSP